MMKATARNLLLLSGSRAAGGLPEDQKPGFLDFAQPWITEFFGGDGPILFVPYARPGGTPESRYFQLARDRLSPMGIRLVQAPETESITESMLDEVSGIFVGGGHTPTLLHKLQVTGGLGVIRKAVDRGLRYMGSSAGSLIACPTIKTNNDMPGPANDVMDLRSLGLISFQLNCHYMDDGMHDPRHQGETRDTRLKEFCTFNPDVPVLGLYEGQALRVQSDEIELWTSKHARGLASPVFENATREEVVCEPEQARVISDHFRAR